MSVPKQSDPPLSTYSSKQSLRAKAAAQARAEHLGQGENADQQQHDHESRQLPEDAALTQAQAQAQAQAQEQASTPTPEEAEAEIHTSDASRPAFNPFFALIEDASLSEFHHPTVHYIFSDDDTDIVTEAALRTLEADYATPSSDLNTTRRPSTGDEDEDEHSASRKQTSLPPPQPGVREQYIVIDVEPTSDQPHAQTQIQSQPSQPAQHPINIETAAAVSVSASPPPAPAPPAPPYTIASAHSLTPSWQVLSASINPAPTFDGTPNDPTQHASSQRGLMLRIEGTGGLDLDLEKNVHGATEGRGLEEMMDNFEKRMAELRRVVEAGGMLQDADEPRDEGPVPGQGKSLGETVGETHETAEAGQTGL